jgi:hypothetical protein
MNSKKITNKYNNFHICINKLIFIIKYQKKKKEGK